MPAKATVRPLRPRQQHAPAKSGPRPGWNQGVTAFANPRAPSVPASLRLNLEEYYAGCALCGSFAAQMVEPDLDWITELSLAAGEKMARKARKKWGR